MSIVKNNTSTTDDNITIKALSEIGTYTLSEKCVLTSSGYKPYYLSNSGFYFMMRCEIPEGASGYLMGIKTSGTASVNNTFYIHYASGTITWKIGNSTYTKAREAGVHDIGWANGKPIYDNALVDNSATAQSGIHTSKMAICGVNTDDTFSFISSLTLYRVDMEVYQAVTPTVSSRKYLERFYLSASTLVNAMKIPEATMVCYNASGGAGTGSASGTPTYGVQLDDLRYLTGSGYRDLMAIVCEDNTAAAESYADGEDRLTKNDEVHKFAFRLADGTKNTVTSPISLPTGYSVTRVSGAYETNFDWWYYKGTGDPYDADNYTGEIPYVKGDLIYGRKPNWSIWADGMKWGRYVEGRRAMKSDVNMIYQNLYFLRFNLFKDFKGQDMQELLKRWDGYDSAAYHIPAASVLDGLNLEFHNRIACTCDSTSVMTGYTSSGRASAPDDGCAFRYSLGTSTIVFVKIGNAAPWDIPREQQTGDYRWIVRGVAVDFVYDNGTHKYVLANAAAYGEEKVGGSGTDKDDIKIFALESTTDKTAFRDNGKEIGDAQFVSSLAEGLWGIYSIDQNGKLTSVTQATLPTYCKMVLLSNQPTEEITENSKTYLDYVLPRIGEQNVVAKNDPISYNTGKAAEKGRIIIGELGGTMEKWINDVKTTCEIQIYKAGSGSYASPSEPMDWNKLCQYYYNSGTSGKNMGYCTGAAIALKPKDGNSLIQIGDNDIICYMDYRMSSTRTVNNVEYNICVGRYIGFVAPEYLGLDTNVDHWSHPYNDGEPSQNWGLYDYDGYAWPAKLALAGDGPGLAYARAALFRWRDLRRIAEEIWQYGDSTPYVDDRGKYSTPMSYVKSYDFIDTMRNNIKYPATAHMRVFDKAHGPVAWDLDIRGQEPEYYYYNESTGTDQLVYNTFNVDYLSGQQYIQMSPSGSQQPDYRFYFLNDDRIMHQSDFAGPKYLAKIITTAWVRAYGASAFTRYDAKYEESGNVPYAIPAFSVYVDQIPLHDSHTEARMTTIATFTSVQPNTTKTSGIYKLKMSSPLYNADYVLLPNGAGNSDLANNGENGSGLKGFFHFDFYTDDENFVWPAGSLYVFRFGFGTLTTYNNAKYDGTTN